MVVRQNSRSLSFNSYELVYWNYWGEGIIRKVCMGVFEKQFFMDYHGKIARQNLLISYQQLSHDE